MERIREETEVDRTKAWLEQHDATLPLVRGNVEVTVTPEAAKSVTGQRLVTLLVNELARMKGVVRDIHVVGCSGAAVRDGVPLTAPADFEAALAALVASLNSHAGPHATGISFTAVPCAAVRVRIGASVGTGLTVAADGWRALFGRYVTGADWNAVSPFGVAMAAALATAEVFKGLLEANGGPDPQRRSVTDMAYSVFNFGANGDALQGPPVQEIFLRDLAVVGCGAGGSATLYVLSMHPNVRGEITLIEPSRHKLSNLNRYLMTTASDVHLGRHKLSSAVAHLAQFAPRLRLALYAQPWEELDEHPWPFLLSTVDTVEARWAIQARALPGVEILDGAVLDLLYSVLRVVPGGRCLECKHPYDPDLMLKQRAARWGQTVETIREWTRGNPTVTRAMVEQLARTQNRPETDFALLVGETFGNTPPLTECGATPLRTDVPSQAPVLPVATTAVGVVLAAEIAKRSVAPEARIRNWIAHDLARSPDRPKVKWRPPVAGCRHHDTG